ncbi:MAG: hypothetical protein ACOYK8_09930, partial [Alphaproteobacteria bacterium]
AAQLLAGTAAIAAKMAAAAVMRNNVFMIFLLGLILGVRFFLCFCLYILICNNRAIYVTVKLEKRF